MQVEINGESREVKERMTLFELIEHLSLAPERLAVELNQTVVRRADWPRTTLEEGDRIEIVHFVGGG
ncbi:MAG TPA: sulfur carrier protein ThiS [Pyrinomonadaceae bacterium]